MKLTYWSAAVVAGLVAGGGARAQTADQFFDNTVIHEIRIQISGGSHPQHDRNLGTGEPAASGAVTRPSHRTLLPSSSRLLLPVTS